MASPNNTVCLPETREEGLVMVKPLKELSVADMKLELRARKWPSIPATNKGGAIAEELTKAREKQCVIEVDHEITISQRREG